MCGIAGIYQTNYSRNASEENMKKMLSTLVHRGPDGWGVYHTEGLALGHVRLSIIDISGGNQPFITERHVISFNGEIYNHIELREELRGAGVKFSSSSDTEVALKAFEAYGPACFAKFNGQFAMLIWDKREKTLTVARDRYGIRPLYVLEERGGYIFSSEMKAFDVLEGYERSFEPENLLKHALLWNSVGDNSLYSGIRSVPGGTYEVYARGKQPVNRRYYEIGETTGGVSPGSLEEAKEEFTALLDDAVKLRLRSDVPVGNYLSGGIDSSVITHLTALHNDNRFKTFSVAFEDEEHDESSFQKEMSDQLGSEHFEVKIDSKKIDDNFQEAAYHFERPVFRTAAVPLFLLSEEVQKQDVKVVLTGEAADEILFGYDSFKELKLLEAWRATPDSEEAPNLIKKLYPHLQHYGDAEKFGLLKMYYEGFLEDYDNELTGLNIRVHNNQVLANFLNKDWKVSYDKDALRSDIRKILPENFESWSLLRRNQFLEMKTLLPGYLLSSQGDRMSLAHSVEGRYPFLDHRLIEKLFYYDDAYKLRDFSEKDLLKKSFAENLPDSILNRPKKPYTAPDLRSFFRDGAWSETAAHYLSTEMIKDYGNFDHRMVDRFIKKFELGMAGDNIGYRDNMLVSFILSAQMIQYWIKNPKLTKLDEKLKKVEIYDY